MSDKTNWFGVPKNKKDRDKPDKHDPLKPLKNVLYMGMAAALIATAPWLKRKADHYNKSKWEQEEFERPSPGILRPDTRGQKFGR